jgi:hypothetical protein
MTLSLCFLILTRDAGSALSGLAQDIAAVARAGDSVVLVDDGSRDDTLSHIARITTAAGWGAGTGVTRIICTARGEGDAGIAANIALQAAKGDLIVMLPGGMRLNRDAFIAARDQSVAQKADLLVCGRGLPSAHRLILHRRLLTPALRWAEGGQAHGDLNFVLRAEQSAQNLRRQMPVFSETPPDTVPNKGFSAAAQAFVTRQPGARGWLLARSAEWDLPPGADPHAPWLLHWVTPPLAAPVRTGVARLRIACLGRHANRQPFAYAALRPLWQEFADLTGPSDVADLLLLAHPSDAGEVPDLAERARRIPAALLSEEPFWDTLFSPDPLAKTIPVQTADGQALLHQRNHHNAAVFRHQVIPYYLLTHHRFAIRYAARFARNAALDAADWQQAFASRPLRSVFMAARRVEGFHDIKLAEGNIMGLCAWRTRLAQTCRNAVERSGEGWPGSPGRFGVADWHLDKLVRLDGKALMISALENTHQPDYLSEKLFDAFACGALPLYMASPLHRVHDLGLPEQAWINLWGTGPGGAARMVDALAAPGPGVCAAYAGAQKCLATIFTDNRLWLAERRRLAQALRAVVTELTDLGPAG